MGVRFTHLTMLGAISAIAERIALQHYDDPLTVFTPNTEQLVQTTESVSFLKALNAADITIPDSVGLVTADWWRAALTGKAWAIRERVAGVDLAENLLLTAAQQGWKVVLVGGMDHTAQTASEHLKKRISGLQVWSVEAGKIEVGSLPAQAGWKLEDGKLLTSINEIKPDILFVGFGAPKQENWVLRHKGELNAQVVMVVGGAIDMWAGNVKRAPQPVRRLGLEWGWRLAQEPWRLTRQLRLIKFIGKALR